VESGEDEQERVFPASVKGRSGSKDMTKQQEFLDTLTNPVRAGIKKNIEEFFQAIRSPDVISTESIGEEGRVNLYITARNKDAYDIVEHFLEIHFPSSEDYTITKAFGGPNVIEAFPSKWLMMYYVVEASCYD